MTWEIAASLVAVAMPITAAIISRRPANHGSTRGDIASAEKRLNKRIDDLHADFRELRQWLHDRY
jgi:hypothetical protein